MGSADRRAVATPGRVVETSAEPSRVRIVLDRIGPATVDELDERALRALAAVAGTSDSLGDLLAESPAALDVLRDLDAPTEIDDTDPDTLCRSHRLGLLRWAARDLLGLDELDVVVTGLSQLATEAIDAARVMADVQDLAVIGMGKYGAGELNFVSDVDIVLLAETIHADTERGARRFLDIVRRCFRVDVDLRPGGRNGALVRSLDGYRSHWDRWAEPWEFQALLKARVVTGPAELGAAFDAAVARALWSRPFDREDLRQIRRLKARAEEEVRAQGLDRREVKRGPGGIRDIEFSVQLLQLVHGGADPALRRRRTLDALHELVDGDYVDRGEAEQLSEAYRFLRRVEHRLQLVNEQQTHTVPTDRDQRRRLARSLGYRGEVDAGPTERFDRDLGMHQRAVRRVHEGWYFRPLLDAFAGTGPATSGVTEARLAAFGFRDAARTEAAVAELSAGFTRTSRLMRQLLPLVLDWLSQGPDPDLGLLGLRRLVSGEQRRTEIIAAFRDSAETARALCELLATAPIAIELLEANPDVVSRLDDVERLRTRSRDELLDDAWRAVGWRGDPGDQQLALRRWHRRQLLGIIARDIGGHDDVAGVGADLSALVETVVETALRLLAPDVPFAVIGMGRLGGRTLSYGSDVDLVFVHDASGGTAQAGAKRAAAEILRFLRGPTPSLRIVDVDIDLRPEGRRGPLARSLESYRIYLERWSAVWERQALLRARPIAGDAAVGSAFADLVDDSVWGRPLLESDVRDVRRMKARMEAERLPRGIEPWQHCKLGPGALSDIEWTVQLLQWRHAVRGRGTLATLEALVADGRVPVEDGRILEAAHEWCDRVRNRAWLTHGEADVLPDAVDAIAVLAHALGTDGANMIEEHRRRLRRSRRVVEQLFYGAD